MEKYVNLSATVTDKFFYKKKKQKQKQQNSTTITN